MNANLHSNPAAGDSIEAYTLMDRTPYCCVLIAEVGGVYLFLYRHPGHSLALEGRGAQAARAHWMPQAP